MGRAQAEHAAASLLSHLATQEDAQVGVLRSMVSLLSEHAGKERVVLAVLKTLNHVFNNDGLSSCSEPQLWKELLQQIKKQVTQSKKINKVQAGVQAMVGLLGIEAAADAVRSTALAFTVQNSLGHAYPRVRAVAADALYNALLVDDSILEDDEKSEEVQEILLESPWESDLPELEEPRKKLEILLGLRPAE